MEKDGTDSNEGVVRGGLKEKHALVDGSDRSGFPEHEMVNGELEDEDCGQGESEIRKEHENMTICEYSSLSPWRRNKGSGHGIFGRKCKVRHRELDTTFTML